MRTFILTVLITSISGIAVAADRYIRIAMPGENDSIDPTKPIVVSGSGKGLFEGNVVVRIEDLEGRELVRSPTTMRRADIAAEGTWQTRISIPLPAPKEIKLIAFSPSPKEGDAAITSAPVMLKTSSPGLESVYWRLAQYLGESDEMTPVLPETTVYAKFSNGQITGSAGCNRYFGAYTRAKDNRLTLASQLGSTQMACAPAIARQEQRFLALLSLVDAWQQQERSLLLLDKDRQIVLKFVAAKPAALEDAPWQAIGINNGRGGVVSTDNTHLATAIFAYGKISGNTGCNNFFAAYEIEDDQITIGRVMTTRKHCAEPQGVMEQEQQYLRALAHAHTFSLRPDRLELRDENGSLQVSFQPQK